MAYVTGTLTNFDDFLTRFKTFVTTNSQLVGDGQQWTVLKDSDVDSDFADDALCTGANATSATSGPFIRRIYFSSPGLGGTDTIYHCLTSLKTAGGAYNIELRNMQAFNSASLLTAQVGVSPAHYLLLNNAASVNPYWFAVNGRRAVIVVRVSGTVYESGYIGWGNPHGAPAEVPLPYMTGGTCYTYNLTPSDVSSAHRAFFAPASNGTAIGSSSTLGVNVPNTTNWLPVGNYSSASSAQDRDTTVVTPLVSLAGRGTVTSTPSVRPQGYCYGNTDRKIRPIGIVSSLVGFAGSYGDLDGVYHVSGEGLASEDILDDGPNDYLVIQSAFYTDRESFCAIKRA